MIVITGLGQISALGQGILALHQGLAGELQPTIAQRPVSTQMGELNVPVFVAPEVQLPNEIPDSVKRRMSRMSRMSYAAALEALKESFGPLLQNLGPEVTTRVGLVIGSAYGSLD